MANKIPGKFIGQGFCRHYILLNITQNSPVCSGDECGVKVEEELFQIYYLNLEQVQDSGIRQLRHLSKELHLAISAFAFL